MRNTAGLPHDLGSYYRPGGPSLYLVPAGARRTRSYNRRDPRKAKLWRGPPGWALPVVPDRRGCEWPQALARPAKTSGRDARITGAGAAPMMS